MIPVKVSNEKVVAIVSGGLDSVTMLYMLLNEGYDVEVLSFLYNQKHVREIECAKYHATQNSLRHTIVDLSSIAKQLFTTSALVNKEIDVPQVHQVIGDPEPITYVPNRNMIFLSLAVALAESTNSSAVCYGAQMHDVYGYWDTTPQFVQAIENVLSLKRKQVVKLQAPLVGLSKAQVILHGLKLNVDYSKTWSCYNGTDKPCCTCPTCVERIQAFRFLNLVDPLMKV